MRVAILCNDRIALPALDYLLQSGLAVAVGMPDRLNETQAIVRSRCRQANIPFQLFRKKDLEVEITHWLHQYQPDLVLVKTFPYRIPEGVLRMPQHGFMNFHYAPVPEWRGSNPLFWMIRNGAKVGGVTVHEMNANYDAGPVVLEQSLPIGSTINFGILYTQLAFLGLQLTVALLQQVQAARLQRREQDSSRAQWYAQPLPSDLFINWQSMNAEEITALVRACNPWNKGAGTRWKEWTFGITYASVVDRNETENTSPGLILSVDPAAGFTIASKDGKAVVAEVVYCEEGFFPGYCLSAFGLKKNDLLS